MSIDSENRSNAGMRKRTVNVPAPTPEEAQELVEKLRDARHPGYKVTDVLNDDERDELIELGQQLVRCLQCDINETGLPCRTDRLESVKLMRRYVDIHDTRH